MAKNTTRHFPKKFLWGVSTAAHQVEGGTLNQWTVWEDEHAKSLAAQAEYQYGDLESWPRIAKQAKRPENYLSGNSTQHYELYEKDFKALKALGLNAYRFSVEWSRIEPSEGAWNSEAIEHYRQYIAALKRLNIEPMMTLFHFTLPVWFAERGGFEKRANISYFLRFVEKVITELGSDITYIITINEPEVYATHGYYHGQWPPNVRSRWRTFRVLSNLIAAHKQSAHLIHGMSRRYKVSIAKNSSYLYAGDDAWLTRASAFTAQYADDYVLRRVRRSCDFIGVNYYFSNRFYGYRVHNPNQRVSDLGWDMQPENLEFVLERLYKTYKLPLIITENGLADADDSERKWWLSQTIVALSNALSEGVDVRGYFHWSLLDNFEWDKGKWPRFGLLAVDYESGKRTPRPSAIWWGTMIKRLRGQ